MHISDTRECFTDHLGLWAMDPVKLASGLSAVRSGLLQPRAKETKREKTEAEKEADYQRYLAGYSLDNGVAVIPLMGAMRKKASKFGGCSTIETRGAIRAALEDGDAAAIMLRIDSPGGQVAGLVELADDVRAAAAKKPLAAYIEDLGASAAYWTASAAPRIYCNRTAEVGSLGVLSVLVDESGALEREGIKLHVVSTGPYKGLGADGKVSDKLIEQVREQVDALGAMFRETIAQGRKLSDEAVAAIFTGKIWMAKEAAALGLVDAIMPFENAMSELRVRAVMPSSMPSLQEKSRIVLDATTACASLATSTQAIGESNMLTKEELKQALDDHSKQIAGMVDSKIEAAFKTRDEKLAKMATENVAVEVQVTGATYTADEANKLIAEAATKAEAKAREEFERQARIAKRAAECVAAGALVPDKEIIKQLAACGSRELEDAHFEKLMAQAELASVRSRTAAADDKPKSKNTAEYWEADFEARAKKGEIDAPEDAVKRAKVKAAYVADSMKIPALSN